MKESEKVKVNSEKYASANGITLIALIITIIVMLILVAVSVRIALTTGLFDSAGKATKDWKTSQENEQGLGNGKITIGGTTYGKLEDYVQVVENNNSRIKLNSFVDTADNRLSAIITVTASMIGGENKSYEEFATKKLEGKSEEEKIQIFLDGENYWNQIYGFGAPYYNNIEEFVSYWNEKDEEVYENIEDLYTSWDYENIDQFIIDRWDVYPEGYDFSEENFNVYLYNKALKGKTEEEIAQIFVDGQNYWNELEDLGEPTYNNIDELIEYWSNNFSDEPFTDIAGMCEAYGYSNLTSFAIDWEYVYPEECEEWYDEWNTQWSSRQIWIENPDGYTEENYTEYYVESNGSYTFTAKYGDEENSITVEVNNLLEINVAMTNTPIEVKADGIKVSEIKEGVPIPVGFYYVGGTKDTGVVISDNSNDKNKGDGHNVELEGNQFVWVPVLQNQKIKIEIKSPGVDMTGMGITITDPLGTKITTDKNGNTLSPSGTSYTAEVNPTINGKYKVQLETESGWKGTRATIDVTSLYAQDFFERPHTCTDSTIATYASSVNTYGGFYIARYEAGSETVRTYAGRENLTTVYSKKNMYPYYYISQTNAITQASRMYNKTNVTSSLVNAAAWDRTLNWLEETNAISTNEIFNDSTSWGNYVNSTFEFTGYYSTDGGNSFTNATSSTLKPENDDYLLGTGVSDYTKRNNIYDLAGNYFEWTTETNSYGSVISRGGDYFDYGSYYQAGYRVITTLGLVAFRAVLYIN